MNAIFSATFFHNNRLRLRQAVSDDAPIVLTANGLMQQSGDTSYPFKQDSSFWYLTGIDQPDIVLVIDGEVEYLIVPGRSASREAFDGSIDATFLTKISGIPIVLNADEGWNKLGERMKTTDKVKTLAAPPSYIESHGLYTSPVRSRLIERLTDGRHELKVDDIRPLLTNMRIVKQPEELVAIQKAIDITANGIAFVTDPERLANYAYEFEIESDLTKIFRTTNSTGHAFTPIVASGQRGCTLHNIDNSGSLNNGELIVLDVGAEVSHYAADISRTVCRGAPTERQQAVFDAVLDVQDFALRLLKPGALMKEYEATVEDYMGTKLLELGLIKDATHETIRKYFPHATSHYLGLDVHDVGDYSRPLEPGMVLTCEPGIYIAEESIGIRIEDDVLISDSGNTVLSQVQPKTLILK